MNEEITSDNLKLSTSRIRCAALLPRRDRVLSMLKAFEMDIKKSIKGVS